MLAKSIETSGFDLIDRIGERKVKSALDILTTILRQEEEHDNKYLIEHLTGAEGKKLPYFAVAKLRAQSHNFSVGELVKIFNHLIEADIALESSSHPPEGIMEDLVIRLVG
ncbi:MAG TPA: hypothetical protein VGK02_05360 [Candidatus Aquicultor sp.]